MPKKPQTICSECGALKRGPCPQCGKTAGWASDKRRGSRIARGYGADWQRLRARKRACNPLCEQCTREGRTTIMEEVHHIKPFRGTGDPLRLAWGNLESLCKACHAKKTVPRG